MITLKDNWLWNWFSSLKLKQKMSYLLLFITVVYLLCFYSLYNFFVHQYITQYVLDSNANTMVSTMNSLEAEVEAINNVSKLILTNSGIAAYLTGIGMQETRAALQMKTTIYDLMNTWGNINSIYIMKRDKSYVNVNRLLTTVDGALLRDKEWDQEIRDAAGGYI